MDPLTTAREALNVDPRLAAALAREALARVHDPAEIGRALLLIGIGEYRQGNLAAAVAKLDDAAGRFASLDDDAAQLECLLVLGRAHRDLGDFASASDAIEQALVSANRSGDHRLEADALNLKAGVLDAQGEPGHAVECLKRALDIARDFDLPEQQANILTNIGTLSTTLGDYPRALESLKEGYELLQAGASKTRSRATNLLSLGRLYLEMGDPTEAQALFREARRVGLEASDPMVEAAAVNNLANAHRRFEEWKQARDLFEEALHLARRSGLKQFEIDNLDGLGQVYAALGEHPRAAELHADSLRSAREIGDREAEIDALLNLGRDYLAMDRADRALEVLTEGLTLAQQLERQRSVFEAHELLAAANEQVGAFRQALSHYQQFHRAREVVFNEENEQKTRRLSVQFDLERARFEAEEYRLRTEMAQEAKEEAEAMVRSRTRELEESQQEVVDRLAVAAEYRDDSTGEHTRRVGRNAAAIAYVLGWPEDELQLLYSAARLHDVGKIGIRDAILLKPGKLVAEEFERMRIHTTIGARILSAGQSRLLRMAEEIALAHHERWDGRGYPFGLAGDSIPLSARIVAVADVLDALTHERPYKRAWPIADAMAEIQRQRGHQFDPRVVDACRAIFGERPKLSPLEAPMDWQATAAELAGLAVEAMPEPEAERAEAGLRTRFEHLLAERTQEMEAAKREAQIASRRMQELAYTDPLTELGNRRAFKMDFEVEIARTAQMDESLSVLTVIIDGLKGVNDSDGHEQGETAPAHLRSCSQESAERRGARVSRGRRRLPGNPDPGGTGGLPSGQRRCRDGDAGGT